MDFNFNNGGIVSKLSKKQKLVIASVTAAVLILVIFVIFRGCASSKVRTERKNTLELVKIYMEKNEFDRALDKIDELLIKNKNDKEALELLNQILAIRNGSDGFSSSSAITNANVTVEVDTEGLSEVMKNSIDSMRKDMAKNNDAMRDEMARNNESLKNEMAKNSKATESLIRQQKEQHEKQLELQKQEEQRRKVEEERRKAEEERKKAEAEQKAREAKALEEKRKAEEAKRKAEEEALAKKNAQLKKEINAVNAEISKAKDMLNSGNIENALTYFENAVDKLPVSDGEPAFSASKYSEMALALQNAAEKASSSEEKNRLQEKAIEYANKALEKDSKDPAANNILGQDAMSKRNYQKALEYFSKAISGDNKNFEFYYNMGRAQFMLKKYTEAKSSFTTSTQLNPNFAPARYNLGLTNNKLNDKKAAKNDFIRAHDIDPRYEKAYLEEARVLVQLGEYQNAVNAYQNVIGLNNVNRQALQELGSLYFQTGNNSLAEEAFRKSLALLPQGQNDPLTCYNLSTVLFEQKKHTDAINYAKKAYDSKDVLKDLNAKVNVVYNYALLCDKAGRSDEAISRYAEVLTLNPNHLKTQINLGVMYMNLNPPDTDSALRLFTKVYEQNPKNFEANNNLGSVYLEKKEYANAVKYFQNALMIEPKNNDVRFNLAQAFASDKQFDNAKTTYIELLRADSKYWDGYFELGKVCMALNDNYMAKGYFEHLLANNPGYRTAEIEALLSQIQ